MQTLTYTAVFEPGDSGFGVYFPDIPGCITCGDTLEHAGRMAKEALSFYLSEAESDGYAIPLPSVQPQANAATSNGYMMYPVSVQIRKANKSSSLWQEILSVPSLRA